MLITCSLNPHIGSSRIDTGKVSPASFTSTMDPSQWNNPSQYFAGAAAPPGQGPDDPNNRRQTSRAPLQHHNATRPGPPYPAGQGPYMRGPPLTPAEQAPYLASQPFHDNPYVYPGGQHVAPPPVSIVLRAFVLTLRPSD